MGKHSSWGIAKEGIPKHWSHSPKGTASSLTMSDGTAVAVDFSGASGEDVMLVTTGKAEGQTVKLGKHKITCYFPTTTTPPKVSKAGEAVTVGKQRITLADGNLVLAANGDADRR
jgi:hypothetical protein